MFCHAANGFPTDMEDQIYRKLGHLVRFKPGAVKAWLGD